MRSALITVILISLAVHLGQPGLYKGKGAPFCKMTIDGKVLYASEYGKGIRVFDISDPSTPNGISYLQIGGNVDAAAAGSVLFADSYQHLLVFDMTDPSRPGNPDTIRDVFLNCRFEKTGLPDGEETGGIGGFNGCDGCNQIESVTPMAPAVSPEVQTNPGAVSSTGSSSSSAVSRVIISGDYLLCADGAELAIFEIRIPHRPRFIKREKLHAPIEMMSVHDDLLFLGDAAGKSIYRVSPSAAFQLLSRMNGAGATDPVACAGEMAFVVNAATADGASHVSSMDVRDPASPMTVGSMPVHEACGIAADGRCVFVAAGFSGVRVIDATHPDQLVEIGQVYGINVFDVVRKDRYLFAVGQTGVYILDCTDPHDPIRIGTIHNPI